MQTIAYFERLIADPSVREALSEGSTAARIKVA